MLSHTRWWQQYTHKHSPYTHTHTHKSSLHTHTDGYHTVKIYTVYQVPEQISMTCVGLDSIVGADILCRWSLLKRKKALQLKTQGRQHQWNIPNRHPWGTGETAGSHGKTYFLDFSTSPTAHGHLRPSLQACWAYNYYLRNCAIQKICIVAITSIQFSITCIWATANFLA